MSEVNPMHHWNKWRIKQTSRRIDQTVHFVECQWFCKSLSLPVLCNKPSFSVRSNSWSRFFSYELYLLSAKRTAITLSVNSEFPVGAGLGSSAAFSVSLTGALMKLFSCYQGDKQLVSDWAYQCEQIFHGRPSGIDNSICTFGGAILFKNGKVVEHRLDLPQLPIILVHTNVQRNTKVLVESATKRRENVRIFISSCRLLTFE